VRAFGAARRGSPCLPPGAFPALTRAPTSQPCDQSDLYGPDAATGMPRVLDAWRAGTPAALWSVRSAGRRSRINAQPNEKQVGDKGIDAVARFYLGRKATSRVLVSVKSGKNIGPSLVRDLPGTVETQRAQMGVLITMAEPPRGVIDAANHGGVYTWPVNGQMFPRVQVITVADLLKIGGERRPIGRSARSLTIQPGRRSAPCAAPGALWLHG
jgi:hypothetical protein